MQSAEESFLSLIQKLAHKVNVPDKILKHKSQALLPESIIQWYQISNLNAKLPTNKIFLSFSVQIHCYPIKGFQHNTNSAISRENLLVKLKTRKTF
jgi:hypothetical protein